MPESRGLAVVTGAGSGIGRATAVALASAGHAVALIGRREATLVETQSLLDYPDKSIVLPLDVTDEAAVEAGFNDAVNRLGRLQLLFNNAGNFGTSAPFEETPLADWRAILDVNLTGSFLCARAAFRLMKAQDPPGGRIVNCGSVSAYVPRPNSVAYTASKHAITGLTRSISLEGRRWNIACGQIDVGNAATELTKSLGAGALQADGRRLAEPLMDVANVAEAVIFMASRPAEANVQFLTVMATNMPFIGRG